jgi:hypothetical protein
MQLNSPRKNPYSSLSHAEDELKEQGYQQKLTIFTETEAQNQSGQVFKPKDLQLQKVVRLTSSKVFLSEENKRTQPTILYGLQASSGEKFLIKENRSSENHQVAQNFVIAVDQKSILEEFYSA